MWTGIHTFAPLNDSTSVTIRQSPAGTPHAHILDVTNNTGSTKYLSVDSSGNTSVQKLGVNTVSPNTTIDIAGDFATRRYEDTSTSATLNNVPTTGTSFICYRHEPQDFTITGFGGGQDGKLLHLYNQSSHELTIANESTSSTAGNRINTLSGFDITLAGSGSVDLLYDGNAREWFTRSTVSSGVTGGVTPGVDYGVVGSSETGTGSNMTDSVLSFRCVAGGVYEVHGMLMATTDASSNTPNFDIGFTAGTGSHISVPFTISHAGTGNKVYDAVNTCTQEATTVSTTGLSKNTTYYLPFMGVIIAGQTGRASLIWQLPANSTLTADCYLRAMRLK